MNSISPELTNLCLIAVGVGLLIFFAALLLLRLLRGSIFGLGLMVMRMISEPKEEETKVDLSGMPQRTGQDLRAQAQSIDFDAAVAKHRQGAQSQAAPPGTVFPNAPNMQPPPPQVQGFPPPKPPRQDDGTTR
jgi:hypothetical protein